MNDFYQSVAAMATGAALGFLALAPFAKAVDALEGHRCPGVPRVQVNPAPLLGDWAAWGACPRQGLVTPLKP